MNNNFIEIKPNDCSTCHWLNECFKDAISHIGDSEYEMNAKECDFYTPIFDSVYEKLAEAEYEQSLHERHIGYMEIVDEQNN